MIKFNEQIRYKEEDAYEEASKIKELTGDKAAKEDYAVAEELIRQYYPYPLKISDKLNENHIGNKKTNSSANIEADTEGYNLQSEYDKILKNKYNLIPAGCNFTSDLKNLNNYVIMPNNEGENNYCNIVIYYNSKNKRSEDKIHHSTLTVSDSDGKIQISDFSKIPELRGITKEALLHEIFDKLKSICLDKWVVLKDRNLTIIPPGDWTTPKGNNREGRERSMIDERRFLFFLRQPNLQAVIGPGRLTRVEYGRGGKFGSGIPADISDYHAFIFNRGVIFENAVRENRIYFYNFEKENLENIRGVIERLKNTGASAEEQNQLLNRIGFHIQCLRDKSTLEALGQVYRSGSSQYNRTNHPKHNARQPIIDKWYEELQVFINRGFA